jgi:hypothetical protein
MQVDFPRCRKYSAVVATYRIDGQVVRYRQTQAGDPEWRCDCGEFKRRHLKFGKGFCMHIAVGIAFANDAVRRTTEFGCPTESAPDRTRSRRQGTLNGRPQADRSEVPVNR